MHPADRLAEIDLGRCPQGAQQPAQQRGKHPGEGGHCRRDGRHWPSGGTGVLGLADQVPEEVRLDEDVEARGRARREGNGGLVNWEARKRGHDQEGNASAAGCAR